MPTAEAAFKQLALERPDQHWELDCGRPRQKPGMTASHNRTMINLVVALYQQLDRTEFDVRGNAGHVRRSSEHYYIPDVMVMPRNLVEPQLGKMQLEVYHEPLPLVVEIWSPSTGDYGVESKLLEYQRRGDLEIWLMHPYDRTLRAWRRQPDRLYPESIFAGGRVEAIALSGVVIDLDTLFE